MRITCPRCGYTWETRSRSRLVTCPRCYRKVPNPLWTGTTSTTGTSTGTRSPDIAVWIADYTPELWSDLKELAEEASSPDPSGVEVLVLDAEIAEEILRHHGFSIDETA